MKLQGWSVAGKSWVALIGSILTLVIPTLVTASYSWPQPWPSVLGAVVAVLTAVGVYQAPYKHVSPQQSQRETPWPTA